MRRVTDHTQVLVRAGLVDGYPAGFAHNHQLRGVGQHLHTAVWHRRLVHMDFMHHEIGGLENVILRGFGAIHENGTRSDRVVLEASHGHTGA